MDASQDAYAAVVFSRVETSEGIQLHLIGAKSRVAPRERVTIPRLELLAATIGARLLHSICEVLEPDLQKKVKRYCWSDSTTVLAWIQNQSQWGVFVWNRVQEIRQLSVAEDWRHVPGVLNPADVPSRGCTAQQLVESRWWEGPTWLKQPPSSWPCEASQVDEEEVEKELTRYTLKEKKEKGSKVLSTLCNVSRDASDEVVHALL